jgi:hypothetical protein
LIQTVEHDFHIEILLEIKIFIFLHFFAISWMGGKSLVLDGGTSLDQQTLYSCYGATCSMDDLCATDRFSIFKAQMVDLTGQNIFHMKI